MTSDKSDFKILKNDLVLIIDDDSANLKLLEAALRPLECQIQLCHDAYEALAVMEDSTPDLIISDVNMPGMDGFQLTEKLRQDVETRDIPIILITGMNARDLKIRGLEVGCDDFLTKPYDLSELKVRVKTLLRLSFYRRQLDARQQLDFLIENITDGLVITDQNYKILQHNKTAERLLFINGNNLNIIEQLNEHYEARGASGTKEEISLTHMRNLFFRPAGKNTNALYLMVEISFVRHADTDEGRVVFILKDVTNEQVEQQLKHDFLSLISHKLKSPIAVIAEMANMLKSIFTETLNKKQETILEQLKENSMRLELLVDRLVSFSTINNINLLQRQNQSFDPISLINESVKHKSYYFSNKSVETEYNTELPEDFVFGNINEGQFTFIIDNLVENAIKFSLKPAVKIHFKLLKDEQWFILSVTDDGPGIPPEVQNRIFESFYQYEKIFTGNVEGMGIGLAMVKQIVDNVNGKIEVKSELEKGSTFIIYFPLTIKFEWDPDFEEWT